MENWRVNITENMKLQQSKLNILFTQFQQIPKKDLIDRPDELIKTNFRLSNSILVLINASVNEVYFTRRTLKHIAEKGDEGKKLFRVIPNTLMHPYFLYKTDRNNRLALSRPFINKNMKRYFVVILELSNRKQIIITVFIAKEKYLKNFEILWRTAT